MQEWRGVPWAYLVLLLCTLPSTVCGLSSQTRTHGLVRRQVAPAAPPLPTTTGDFMPLPPMAAPTEPATTTNAAPAPPLTFNTQPTATTAQETIPPASTSSNLAATALTTSLIHITALPPAPSGRSIRQRRVTKPFNAKYLAPVFAVLGIALGAFTAWIILICRSRYRTSRRRANSLEPGSAYAAPSGRVRPVDRQTTTRSIPWSAVFGRQRPEGHDTARSTHSWFPRVLTARRGGPVLTGIDRTARPPLSSRRDYGNESYSFLNEDDPFLLPTPSATTGASTTTMSTDPLGRSQPLLTTSFLSPGVASVHVEDGEWEQVPHGPMLRNSIRRDVLDRLKSGAKARRGHARVDSDGNIVETKLFPGEFPSDSSSSYPISERTQSMASSSTNEPSQPLMSERSNPGFRLVDEDPDEVVASERSDWGWALPWVAAVRTPTDDRFTAFPSRRNTVGKRKTPVIPAGMSQVPSSSPSTGHPRHDRRTSDLPRSHSSVLPSSPPLLHSPPLEAQLFFGPIPPIFRSTPSFSLGLDKDKGDSATAGPSSDSNVIERWRNNLQSNKETSILPFPASNVQKSTPYRRRLTKSPISSSTDRMPQPASPHPPTRSPTSASNSSAASRKVALNKVDQILAKSWSQREMTGMSSPKSPTMFGTAAEGEAGDDAHSPGAMRGIEQRLTGM